MQQVSLHDELAAEVPTLGIVVAIANEQRAQSSAEVSGDHGQNPMFKPVSLILEFLGTGNNGKEQGIHAT